MDNQTPPPVNQPIPSVPEQSSASAPVTPSGTVYTPPPTNTPPPSLPTTSPQSSKKWLLIGMAIIILLILAGGGYLYYMNMQMTQPVTPKKVMIKPSPTMMPSATPMATDSAMASDSANWKTYTSLDGTYTIQYPSNTFVRFICPNEELTLSVRRDQKEESITMPTCGRDGLYDIEVITLKQPHIPQQSDENYSVVKKDVMVDGIPATAYTTTLIKEPEGPSVGFSEDVYVTNDGKYYQIHLGQKDLQSTFDKMLASFKFTK